MFRGTAGAGSDVYRVWYDGENTTTTDVTCMTTDVTSCNRHYRHPMVDSWKSLRIRKVNLIVNNELKLSIMTLIMKVKALRDLLEAKV